MRKIFYVDLNIENILDKKQVLNEVGADFDDRKAGCRSNENKKQHLNPFLSPDDDEAEKEAIKSSKEVYPNRNPFEIESDLDRLNPFVRTDNDERNSVLSENTTLFDEDEDIDRNLVTDSENSCDKEITLSNNNDSFEVRHH